MDITDTGIPVAYINAALYRAREQVAFLEAYLAGAVLGEGSFRRVHALATEAREAFV